MSTSLLVAVVVSVAGAIAAPAVALTVVEDELEAGYYAFAGEPCGTPATVSVFLPIKARLIEVSEPIVSDPIYNDLDEEGGRISAVTVDREGRRPKVIWTAEPTPLLCFGVGWESSDSYFAVDYLVPRSVRLGGLGARRYSERALSRTFGPAYTLATESSLSCRRRSSIRVPCRTGWFQGDTTWGGTVAVWLSKRRGELRHRPAFSMRCSMPRPDGRPYQPLGGRAQSPPQPLARTSGALDDGAKGPTAPSVPPVGRRGQWRRTATAAAGFLCTSWPGLEADPWWGSRPDS